MIDTPAPGGPAPAMNVGPSPQGPQINPQAIHTFLVNHPIGKSIAAHTGYGPGHPVHDTHHRMMHRQMLRPEAGPAAPTSMAGPVMGPPGAPAAALPVPKPAAAMGPLGAVPPPQRPPMPSMQKPNGASRAPLPAGGAQPQ